MIKIVTMTDPKQWASAIRAQTPNLVELGKKSPKLVLSFGGAGWLISYSLGVAKFLQEERKELLASSYLLGAGSGVIPAMALACGPQHVKIDAVLERLIADMEFNVTNEPTRRAKTIEALDALLPGAAFGKPSDTSANSGASSSTANDRTDLCKLINGRVALTLGFSNRDAGYLQQRKENIYYGHHVTQWDDRADVIACMTAAMGPNANFMMQYRDAPNVMRGTLYTMSSELDQFIRHVHIHGYCGYRYNRHQTRHNIYFGKHGFLANTHFYYPQQAAMAFMPKTFFSAASRAEHHKLAFEKGFLDARRYERWEEDPYYYAKPDRSGEDDFNWRSMRASIFGGKKGERFEL